MTAAAMLEAERIARDPSVKGGGDMDELLTEPKDEASEEEKMLRLMSELDEGRRSGEEEGWISEEEVRARFLNRSR